MKIHIIAAFLACLPLHCALADAGSPASEVAKRQGPLDITLTVTKIVRFDGGERRLEASNANPGDILEYRTEYKNIGTSTLSALTATLPLPVHTTFVLDSAYPAAPEVATRSDKDKFLPMPIKGISKDKEGLKSGESPTSAYGVLRWRIVKLDPGKTIAVGARVRVDGIISEHTPTVPLTVQTGSSISQ